GSAGWGGGGVGGGGWLLVGGGRVDLLAEVGERPRADDEQPLDRVVRAGAPDDERWRAPHAGRRAVTIVLLNRARVLGTVETRRKRGGVQAESLRVIRQLLRRQRLLVLEEQVVHLPLLPLSPPPPPHPPPPPP